MTTPKQKLPAGIWALGLVSLLMDVSSEMIHSLLPVFLVGTLGMSAFALGLLEGVAEATALIVKVFSGALSDWWGRRKGLAVFGYALGALAKPLFPLAGGVGLVLTARLLDRVGKGIRGAPRDALVADIAPPALRGAAFGLRQSLDTVGAFLGPLIAIGLMLLWQNDVRAVFWVAVIPAWLAVMVLILGVREPVSVAPPLRRNPLHRAQLAQLPAAYWHVVWIGALFALARFSEAFLVLRAQQQGLAMALVPLVLIVMNLIYALSAYPLGALADRLPPRRLLVLGMVLLIAADLLLSQSGPTALWLGIALWGLHMGATQGVLATLIAQTAPAQLRGTAFGVFNLLSGVAVLVASGLAGWLWDAFGAAASFLAGAALALLALINLLRRVPA